MMSYFSTSLMSLAAAAGPSSGHGHGSDPLEQIAEATESLASTPEALRPVLLAVIAVGFVVLLIGIAMCLIRILRGPHLSDRVVAGDTLTLHLAGIAILLTMLLATPLFFDAVLIIAIIGFASTVAFSQYIGSRIEDEKARQAEDAREVQESAQ